MEGTLEDPEEVSTHEYKEKQLNVLVLGAHPNVVDFSCEGTITRRAQEDHRVMICVVTDGRAHPIGDPKRWPRTGERKRSIVQAWSGRRSNSLGSRMGG